MFDRTMARLVRKHVAEEAREALRATPQAEDGVEVLGPADIGGGFVLPHAHSSGGERQIEAGGALSQRALRRPHVRCVGEVVTEPEIVARGE